MLLRGSVSLGKKFLTVFRVVGCSDAAGQQTRALQGPQPSSLPLQLQPALFSGVHQHSSVRCLVEIWISNKNINIYLIIKSFLHFFLNNHALVRLHINIIVLHQSSGYSLDQFFRPLSYMIISIENNLLESLNLVENLKYLSAFQQKYYIWTYELSCSSYRHTF